MKKKLPIQLVEFRKKKDDFLPEGGGSKNLPKWVTDSAIQKNGITVCRQLDLFSVLLERRKQEQNDAPILVVANLNKEATAKSHRGEIRFMFDNESKRNVIGMNGFNDVIVKIEGNADLKNIKSRFSQYNSSTISKSVKKAIAAVEDMHLFTPCIDANLNGQEVKVRLIDYLDDRLNTKCIERFDRVCKENGLLYESMEYSDSLFLFRIEKIDANSLEKLSTLDGILSIKQMPHILITEAPEPNDTIIDVKRPKGDEDYPTVGLLDTGVETIPHLEDWILPDSSNLMNIDSVDITKRHGTFVAGIMLYGDELQGETYTGSVPFKIQDCIVNTEKFSVSEYELIQHVKANIEHYSSIKIWNLSQGSNVEISDNKFSDFAIALDELQKKKNIIICKSAGNQSNLSGNIRITEGAESIRSLVIGSLALEKITENDGEANCRSPFSRIGFGPEGLIKPDLVHYGGNIDTHIKSFSIYGNEALNSGTSFATPRVTAIAASLSYLLGDKYDPLLVKALMIHSASYPKELKVAGKERLKQVGYGMPAACLDILHNDVDEFTMVFNVTFGKGRDIQVAEFPYPQSLVDEEGFYYGDISVTLAVDPILNPNESTEYCQSEVDVKLETYDRLEKVTPGAVDTPKTIRNSDRLRGSENILAATNYSKKVRKNKDDRFVQERTLIEDCLKFQPIKKYHVLLEEMTPANKKQQLQKNKKWALKMKALYRDSAETSFNIDGEILEQRAVLLITIRDPYKKGVVYNECMNQLELYNFPHNNLVLREHIHITNNG